MTWFFTADEHYGHRNVIKHCNRPFDSVKDMDETMIERHNSVVKSGDVVVHAGDFTLAKRSVAEEYVRKLNGNHAFLLGSHDRWLGKRARFVWERKINGQLVVVCHYAMRTWPKSHYGSWQLHGHSHGRLKPKPNQLDVGVDNNDFRPFSFEEVAEIMRLGVIGEGNLRRAFH
jgi:calcineurin-like phosphoesterase family protein